MSRRPPNDRGAGPTGVLPAMYRCLLYAYPAAFRRRLGGDLLDAYLAAWRHTRRRRGRAAAALTALRGALDAVRSGLAERLRPFDGHVHGRGPRPDVPPLPPRERAPMESLLQDLRFAVRTLAKRPLFTAVAVVTLALGIGANTTVFSIVNSVLLRPLPVANADRLVEVYAIDPEVAEVAGPVSYPDYVDLRERSELVESFVGHSLTFANWQHEGRNRLLAGEVVTGNYFEDLGIGLALGRAFLPEENATPETNPVAVVSWRLWQGELGGGPEVLGRELLLNGVAFDVVGVAARGHTGMMPGIAAEVWVPAMMSETVDPTGMQNVGPSPAGDVRVEQRANRWMMLKALPRTGVTPEQVRAELDAIMTALSREHPETNEGYTIQVIPTRDVRLHPLIDGALAFAGTAALAMVGLVLVIACANLANMLLARAGARHQEIAVRVAMGAGRGRLLRQLLTESLLLSAVGAALGLGLAGLAARLIAAYQPPLPVPLSLALGVDLRVFGFTLGLALASAIAFGLVPALRASRPDLVESLKAGGRGNAGAGARLLSLRNALVVGQVTLCTTLLIGAALLVRSLQSASRIDLGFDPVHLAAFTVDPEMHGLGSDDEARPWLQMLAGRLRETPGVESVSLAARAPLSFGFNQNTFWMPGHQDAPDDPPTLVYVTTIDDHYFSTLGVDVVQGRGIEAADAGDPAEADMVAVVNRAFVERYYAGEDVVGKVLRRGAFDGTEVRIIGVSEDYKVQTVGEEARPYVHFSGRQAGTFLVRTAGPAAAAMPALREAFRAVQPGIVFIEEQSMLGMVSAALFPARAAAALLGLFSALALVLAAVGLYGVIAYGVSQRTREIGIRIALGAGAGRLLRQVLVRGMGLAAVGLALGIALSTLLSGALSGLLYDVGGLDPLALTGAAIVLLAVTTIANLVPARRAARVDPTTAIRNE